ncbi:hypothetical protein [Ensifer canadensis]
MSEASALAPGWSTFKLSSACLCDVSIQMTNAPSGPRLDQPTRLIVTRSMSAGFSGADPTLQAVGGQQASEDQWNRHSGDTFSLHIHFISLLLPFGFAAKVVQASIEEDRFRRARLMTWLLEKWEESCSDI